MLDTKFTCTVTALVIALVALCTVEATTKSQLVEGFWNTPARTITKVGSQINVLKDAEPNLNLSASTEQDLLGSFKNGDFYATVGYKNSLQPQSTQAGAYGALQNASQQQVNSQAYGPNGFNPVQQSMGFKNAPLNTAVTDELKNNDEMLEASRWGFKSSPNTNIPISSKSVQLDGNSGVNLPGNLKAEDEFRRGESIAAAINHDYENGAGMTNKGHNALNAYLSNNTDQKELSYIRYDENARVKTSAEEFAVPGTENYAHPSGTNVTACTKCPDTKNDYVAQPLMKPDYANGNYNEVERSVLRPQTGNLIPISTMETIDADGKERHTVNVNNLMFTNTLKRNRGLGCPFRGDAVPQGNLSSLQNGMFVSRLAFDPKNNLNQGAMAVMGGQGTKSLNDINLSQAASGVSTTIAGSYLHPSYVSNLVQQQSTTDITQGLQPQATAAERVTTFGQLAVGKNNFENIHAQYSGT